MSSLGKTFCGASISDGAILRTSEAEFTSRPTSRSSNSTTTMRLFELRSMAASPKRFPRSITAIILPRRLMGPGNWESQRLPPHPQADNLQLLVHDRAQGSDPRQFGMQFIRGCAFALRGGPSRRISAGTLVSLVLKNEQVRRLGQPAGELGRGLGPGREVRGAGSG